MCVCVRERERERERERDPNTNTGVQMCVGSECVYTGVYKVRRLKKPQSQGGV